MEQAHSIVSADPGFAEAATFRDHVQRTIDYLGPLAGRQVPTAILAHFGAWLEWPHWLRDGTSLSCSGPLPPYISAADDLTVIANIIDYVGEDQILRRIMEDARQPVGPLAELAFANAPTLGDTLRSLVRLINLNGGHLHASIEVVGNRLRLKLEDVAPLGRVADLLGLTGLIIGYRLIASSTFQLAEEVVLFSTYPYDRRAHAIEALFQCQTKVGATVNSIEMPLCWAEKRNATSNQRLWLLAQAQIEEAERERSSSAAVSGIRGRVSQILSDQRRAPRLKQLAAEAGVSTRTVTRLLTADGTSFQEIVEQERRLRAIELISDPSLNLGTVASHLGFTDTSSFGRSFRTWFGQTPGQFRKGLPVPPLEKSQLTGFGSLK